MTKVEKIGREVEQLNREELAAFREWFQSYDAEEWDRQIGEDARGGRLDKLADEALKAHGDGRTKET